MTGRGFRSARLAAALVGLTLLCAAAPAVAATTPYYIDFETNSSVDVSDVAIFNLSVHSGLGFTFTESSQGVTIGNSVLSDGIARTDQTQGAFMIGLVQEPVQTSDVQPAGGSSASAQSSVLDTSTQTGVVIFGHDNYGRITGSSFADAFPSANEAKLISWLEDPIANAQNLKDFANTYWTEFAVLPGESYSAIEFSDGDVVGSGKSVASLTPLGGTPPAAPEPRMWALMLGGVGLAGAALRRRKPAFRAA